MRPILPSCPSILAVTRCTMNCATCIGGPTWSRISPSTSRSATLVGELRQTTCIPRDICSPCLFLFGNGKIFPWISLWVYPARPRAITLFGSLWIALPSQLISSQWILDIQLESLPHCILTGLWPCMEFLLLSSRIEGQSLSLAFGSNSNNVLVLVSSKVQPIIHRLTAKQKG